MNRYTLIGPIIIFLLWTAVVEANFFDPFLLPHPFTVLDAAKNLLISDNIITDIIKTLERILAAFALSGVVGVGLGILLGSKKNIYRSVELVIDFSRSIPASALVPLFLLVLGVGNASKIAVASFAAMLLIIFNVAYSVMHTDPSKRRAARLMGASQRQIFQYITFWETLPEILVSLRHGVSFVMIVIILTEMLVGADFGLGKKIIDFQITYEISRMYAVILLTGMLGYLLNLTLLSVEKRVVHWIHN